MKWIHSDGYVYVESFLDFVIWSIQQLILQLT